MNVGIIGAGYIGRTLAKLASDKRYDVMISNSRGPETLTSTASATGSKAGTPEEAAAFGEIVVVAIPFKNRDQLPANALAGKIVVDANNYYPHREGRIPELDQRKTTTSEMIAALLPSSRVVKAFNAILATDLEKDGRPPGSSERHALPIAGDDPLAKRIVAEFQDRIGFDVVDGGRLVDSWRFERAKPGYCIPLDRTGMERALAAAERDVEVEDGSWRVRMARSPASGLNQAVLPDWLEAFYHHVEKQEFGSAASVFAPDATMRLGVHTAVGAAQLAEALRRAMIESGASHNVTAYFDGGEIKVVRGEAGPAGNASPAFVHVWHLTTGEGSRQIQHLFGASGSGG